jgi:hypothetical protein
MALRAAQAKQAAQTVQPTQAAQVAQAALLEAHQKGMLVDLLAALLAAHLLEPASQQELPLMCR